MERLNTQIFHSINSLARSSVFLDDFMVVCAVAFPYLYILTLIWLFFHNKRGEYRKIVIYAVAAASFGLLVNFLIDLVYFHPRPFMSHLGVQLIPHAPDTSFPSNHATFLFSIAFMLLFFKSSRQLGVLLTLTALLCGLARVFCGVHFPFDIVGSVIVATVASGVLFAIARKRTTSPPLSIS